MKIKIANTVIIMTHDSLAPVKGGGALRTLAVINEIRKRNFQVIVVAPGNFDSENHAGVLYLPIPAPRKERSQILSAIKFNFRLIVRIIPVFNRANIIFAHNTIACIFVPILKNIFRHFRFVLDITDIHAEYLPIGKRNIIEILIAPFLLWYEYQIIKSADQIIAATQAMKRHLVTKGVRENKIQVVYDSVDKEKLPKEKELSAGLGIIHLGAIDRQHNAEILIKAIPKITEKFPQARFFMIGGGREKENIQILARKLGVDRYCVFTGPLPCEEARAFLKKTNIGVITRKDVLPNRIITTLKIFEYWASKTAVISTPLEGIKEIATEGEDVLFFRSGDAEDLAGKINLLLGDRAYACCLATGGYRAVDRFNLYRAAAEIVNFSIK